MKFPLSQISSTGASMIDISTRMASLAAEASGINSSIAGCYGQGGVGGRAGAVSTKMYSQASAVSHLGQVSSDAVKSYMAAEDNIGTLVYSQSGETYSRIPERAATEVAEKPMSTWTKIWKTGAAALSIVGSGTAIVASWAVAGSTGVGAPGAIFVTGYSVNSAVSSFADIKNIWWGDQSKVGQTNWLKSNLTEGGGILTEMLCGDREIGEKIGKGVYSVGNFASAVISARSFSMWQGGGSQLATVGDDVKNSSLGKLPGNKLGKYIQSDMFDKKWVSPYDPETGKKLSEVERVLQASTGNSLIDTSVKAVKEIPTAIKGYADIAFKSDLGSLRYDVTSLGFQIKDINKCQAFYKSTKGIIDLFKDVADTIIPEGITNPSKLPLTDGIL